ncbi:recombinase family protein, partial [Cribrihabitans pelagius]|uniref:recombinase family protein n=1 Tax=Cribrihabitans pelagius TaxID=1765746 RepID=UPI003B5AB96D
MKPQLTPSGEVIRGEREIHPEEADVVRRIFEDYARGLSPKKIAEALNTEGVPAPSGRHWGASTLHGNRQRGTGILNNELYIGRQVWNRLCYVKDPQTGKRISRLNPESEWTITEVPHLRIVDQELWDTVRVRQGELKTAGTNVPVW